jgi:hypothetical protein
VHAKGAGQVGGGGPTSADCACGEGGPPPHCHGCNKSAWSASPVRGRECACARCCDAGGVILGLVPRIPVAGFGGFDAESPRWANRDSRDEPENGSVGGIVLLALNVVLRLGQGLARIRRVPITAFAVKDHAERRSDALHEAHAKQQHRFHRTMERRRGYQSFCCFECSCHRDNIRPLEEAPDCVNAGPAGFLGEASENAREENSVSPESAQLPAAGISRGEIETGGAMTEARGDNPQAGRTAGASPCVAGLPAPLFRGAGVAFRLAGGAAIGMKGGSTSDA